MIHPSLKRIMIFGIPGSGKSTFSLQLESLLHIPLYHLDRYFFIQGWKPRDYDEFLKIQESLLETDSWIIDGNATKSLETRFKNADVAFYFRFNRLLCLWRIFKRLAFKDHRISDRAEGCKEIVRWKLISYLWGFNERVKESILELREKYPHVQFYEMRKNADLKKVIKTINDQN